MSNQALYSLQEENTKLKKAFTKVAYHVQEARYHLDQISTTELAGYASLKSRQSLQARIDNYKKEVAK
jgi:hypothetical protein